MLLSYAKIISALLAIVGSTYLIPIAVAVFCAEYSVIPSFAIPMVVSWLCFALCFFLGRKKKIRLTIKGSFIVVALAWISASIFGSIPLYASGAIPSVTDAFFETVSGITTTGATILSDIESLPRSINMWRCQTHWLGGMGIVALTVALLPLLGVGGFQLIKAETTGPEKGKFTPKIATTAKVLWFIYLAFTAALCILLKLAGMDFIDALSHAFSTLGTGGFSTRNASIGAYNSVAIDVIITVFMFLCGINFTMFFYLFTGKFSDVKDNTELKAYIGIVLIAVLSITLFETRHFGSFLTSLRYSSFQTLTILSTAGYGTADYTTFTPASQVIIFALFFIGGSSGSTAGGVKVIRWVIISKQLKNEVQKTLHPHGVFNIRLDNRAGRKDVVFSVTAFFVMYVLLLFVTTLIGAIFGMDLFSAFTGSLSMVGNVGPAFGTLGPSFNCGPLAAPVKWWYTFAMLAGRLEFYTMMIFFFPDFWKK